MANTSKKIKCLVTGGAGFIGSHIVDILQKNEYEVTIIDDLSTGTLKNLDGEFTFIKADIRDYDFDNLEKQDFVFHLACLARIKPSIENPTESHEVNLDGSFRVLEYCRKSKAKLIFSSTSSLYKGDELPTKETAEIKPKNPYTLQKWAIEGYLRLYHELYGLQYVALRYFNVFGERQILEGAYAAVVGLFLDAKAKGEPILITNNGEQSRDFTYVKDVAVANLMAMDWPTGAYNIGTGKSYSINELAGMVGGKTKYIPTRPGEVMATQADWSKARRKGWKPTKNIQEWISEVNV